MAVVPSSGAAGDQILTIREVAAYLRLPLSTTYRLAERGSLPGQKVGRQWRFRSSILEEWFRSGTAALRPTVLIADDQGVTRRTFMDAQQARGCRILTVSSAKGALEVAETTNLDLVVLDLTLPGMGSVEAVKELQLLRPDVLIVIVTDSRDTDLVWQVLEVGPVTLVQKPLAPERIDAILGLVNGA